MTTNMTKAVSRIIVGIGTAAFLSISGASAAPLEHPEQAEKPRHSARVDPRIGPRIEGLERLQQLGRPTIALRTYEQVLPPAGELQRLAQLSESMAAGAHVTLDRDAGQMGETRIVRRSSDDPSAVFEFDTRSGSFLFNGGLGRYRKEETTRALPAESAASEVATLRLQELGIAPDPKQTCIAHIGALNMGVSDGKGETRTYQKLRTVRLCRIVDGMRVEGHSRIVMQLGEDGALAGLVYQWPALRADAVVSQEALVDERKLKDQALAILTEATGSATQAKLTVMELVLYDDGQGRLEPAYHLILERSLAGKSGAAMQVPFDFYLPLLKDARAKYPQVHDSHDTPRPQ